MRDIHRHRYKRDRTDCGCFRPSARQFTVTDHVLSFGRSHGCDKTAVDFQLLKERWRNFFRCRRQDNSIERRHLRPSRMAVTKPEMNVRKIPKTLFRAEVERRNNLNRENLVYNSGQDRGVIAATGSQFLECDRLVEAPAVPLAKRRCGVAKSTGLHRSAVACPHRRARLSSGTNS